MRALAEFIMRGRLQAALVALVGSLVPMLSPAAVSLVTLSRGVKEGLLVMLWGLLPLLMAFYGSAINPMITLATMAGLVVVVASSEALRLTVSWSSTLTVVLLLSALSVVALNLLFGSSVAELELTVANMFSQLQQQAGTTEAAFKPGRTFLLGVIGYVVALTTVISLILGRWWQAQLYNPGGFREEFHRLRFDRRIGVALLAGVAICYLSPDEYASWAGLVGLPLLLGGVALVHHMVAFYQIGAHWLAIFYVGLLMIGPLSLVLVGLGFLDSILNIRSRLAKGEK
ncbi:MAG: hypothetical protein EP334_05245 [Gammaproteobacteria bacterium]|nr:MAG: hypothetical protein EP334_05245 [Gammaproteobacteria bacterium]